MNSKWLPASLAIASEASGLNRGGPRMLTYVSWAPKPLASSVWLTPPLMSQLRSAPIVALDVNVGMRYYGPG